MPQGLVSDIDTPGIRNLLGYVLSLQGAPNADEILSIPIQMAAAAPQEKFAYSHDRILAGERIFNRREACLPCHRPSSPAVRNGIAPSPVKLGRLSKEQIRSALTQREDMASAFQNFVPTHVEVEGILGHQPGNQQAGKEVILVLDPHGGVKKHLISQQIFAEHVLRQIDAAAQIPHHTFFNDTFSEDEVEALVAFFKALQ